MEKTILFDYQNLIINASKKALPALINTNAEEVPEILRNFKYPISSWPVILPKKDSEALAECCVLIPKLLQEIPELYFENNTKKIADFYFDGNETLAHFAILCSQKKIDISCRLDLIKTTTGFKVLEVNAGSSLGGMEFQNFEPVISGMHPELSNGELGIVAMPTQQIYIDFIIQKAISYMSEGEEEINIFMVGTEFYEKDLIAYKEAENFYNEIFNNEIGKYKKKGSVIINRMSEVKLKNNVLTYKDKRIHVVLISDFALKDISPDIFRAFMMNAIYFPDHQGVGMLRDKRNLVLLRRLAEEGKFSASENEKILTYIPWSVLINETTTLYKGSEHILEVLLQEKKDDFVIKVADGLQGNDVFIGKFLSKEAWSDAIKKAINEKKYIVQEYIPSDYLLAPNKNNEWTPHSLIWGAFGFGDAYGGTWVRMAAKENALGAINAATGAVEVIVYEEISVNHHTNNEEKEITNSILGEAYNQLMSNTSKNLPAFVDLTSKKLPKLLQEYHYPVSSWPVIIDTDIVDKLKELCVRIPKMIQQIPELYFKNDLKKIADFYFNGDNMLAQYAMLCHQKKIEIGCRLDLTYSDNEFKILEANVGSAIGGWQVQSFDHIIRDQHTILNDTETEHFYESRNTQLYYINFLIDNLIKIKLPDDDTINVFMCLGVADDTSIYKNTEDFLNELFQQELSKRGLKGRVCVADYSSLHLMNGKLYKDDLLIHGLAILTLNKEDLPPDVFRAFFIGNLYFPDHLGTIMYGDKRNLELLRTLAEQQAFSEEDNDLVLNSIPWTKKITPNSKVLYRGKTELFAQVLKNNKENLVIKASNGSQGEDVFVGKFLTDKEWEEAINLAENTSTFIAQEFCNSNSNIAPNKIGEWTPHKLIWGAFGFGENYGGVWVRMSEEKTDIGVINSASGAVEAIVYERLFFETLIL
ncbi:hypothetical protein H2O64_19440 [Kordia sp. YSTF-M3]|uniref:Uncharacterized protein n=1 Tax=Kordia aestuariivivens TaxID=2759037 RepID=A0ABR7QE65_9FLAO|nr:hypothetical protein [Kordia aestuariivivens]MBC8756857.1 hypothetical protein [Kordia aestuariivivens]